MVRGEAGDSKLSFKSNKDDFTILVSFGGLSPNISPTPLISVLPLDLLPPQPQVGRRQEGDLSGGNSHFVVVYLGLGVTQLFIAE